jgi:hypothetical protein
MDYFSWTSINVFTTKIEETFEIYMLIVQKNNICLESTS